MNTTDLLRQCEALGAVLWADGEHIDIEAPAPLPGPLLETLRTHKPELLAALRLEAWQVPNAGPGDAPMQAREAFWALHQHGVRLAVDADDLTVLAPPRWLTGERRRWFEVRRRSIVAALTLPHFAKAGDYAHCIRCGRAVWKYLVGYVAERGAEDGVALCQVHYRELVPL